MGLRYISEYKGGWHPRQVPTRIEIYDKDSVSVGNPWFRVSDPAVINWAELDELKPGVQPSHCKFTMLMETPSHHFFLEDLKQAQEDRFTVVVYQGPDKKFIGNIVADGMQKEDSNHPTPRLRIYAADGLQKYKTIAYEDPDFGPYDSGFWTRVTGHLERIFDLLDTKAYFGAADGVYVTADLYEAAMNPSGDVFDQMVIQDRVFLNINNNGAEAKNCYEVLEIICRMTDTRLFMVDGKFIFESLNVRCERDTFNRHWYTIAMASNGTVGYDSDNIVQVNLPVARGRGPDLRIRPGLEIYPPPVRYVTVTYDHGVSEDFLHGRFFNFLGNIGQQFVNAGIATVPDEVTRIKILGTVEMLPKWSSISTDDGRYKIILRFWIQIGDHYYQRQELIGAPKFLVSTYEKEEWVTTVPDGTGVGEYCWLYPQPFLRLQDDQRRLPLHFEILSLPIPTELDGEFVTLGLRFDLYEENSQTPLINALIPFDLTIQMEDGQAIIIDKENSKVEPTKLAYRQTNNVRNSLELSYTIPASDGPNNTSIHRLRIGQPGEVDPNNFTDSVLWSSARYSSKHHTQLLALELMHRRSEPRTILDGDIYTHNSLLRNYKYCGNTLIWLSGEYDTGTTIAKGKWLFRQTLSVKDDVHEIEEFSQDIGGKQVISPEIIAPPAPPHIQYLEGPITEITPDIEIPDLTGLSDLEIWERIKPMINGLGRRITTDPRNDGWKWNNTTKKIIPDELIRSNDWVKVEYDRSLLYETP